MTERTNSFFTFPLCTLYLNRFFSLVGDYAYMVSLSLIVAKISPTAVMFLWLVKSLSSTLALPFTSIIDRMDKKVILMVTEISRGILVLCMPLFFESWILLILVALTSFLGPFFYGAMNPVITVLTTEENRYRVNSLIGMIASASYFIGPLLGGLLLIQDNSLPFLFQGLVVIGSSMLFLLVKIPSIPFKTLENQSETNDFSLRTMVKDLSKTTQTIYKNKVLFTLVVSNTLYLCGGYAIDAYEVLFVKEELDFSDLDYSMVISYLGVAFIISGLLNTLIGKKVKPMKVYILGILIACIANLTFALSSGKETVYIAFSLLSLGVTLLNTSLQTLFQNIVPVESQGRFFSFLSIVPEVFTTLTVILAGILINTIEIRTVILSLAIITCMAGIFASINLYVNKSKNVKLEKSYHQGTE